jgi:hypothetical protein
MNAAVLGVEHGEPGGVVAAVFEPLQALEQDGRDGPLGDGADDATHNDLASGRRRDWAQGLGFLHRVFASPDGDCLARVRSVARGASRLITEPAPMVAPAPISTGATSAVLEPMKASSPMTVRCLLAPS